ncbi:MAG: SDR family NAD(P)-dependent oxidoreductase [Bacteroidia bacterium]|nr:SDR family NAD(P)-dependent oxidoreductase [Bacteroidia bacterium]
MNHYYITGTSRGIGKSMAEYLLRDHTNHVVGLSRTNTLSHPNFSWHKLDLSDPAAVKAFRFSYHPGAGKIWLINNAGTIGQIKPAGKLNPDQLIACFHVNLVSPAVLINSFIEAFREENCDRMIVNVSSGAGKNPIDGWSSYCASKSGLDMFSRVVDKEQKISRQTGIRIFSIAPGIVDTQMQTEIRSASPSDFSRLEDFQKYKNDNVLGDPRLTAEKYFSILAKIGSPEEIVFSVKDH